jgi:MerR family transcriptional regulator, light-induced transcriptional regulator
MEVPPTRAAVSPREIRRATEGFAGQLLTGRASDAVKAAVDALDLLGGDLARLYDEVLRAAAVRVGDLWHVGSLSVAEEHAATSTLRRAMAAAKGTCSGAAPREEVIVLACPPEEAHYVGLHMLADVLELEGFDVRVLGAQTPSQDTADYALRHRAALVALSCATPISVGGLITSIAALRDADPELPVIVGGRCLHEFPNVLHAGAASAIVLSVAEGVDVIHSTLSPVRQP